ncbi:hypothetical protein [Synechococcus sp. BIOS-E4-1]|uniref:hypothetical protein n=1 Tax=Synechococcus sp. BIOS-E4-1 TaxID=1400864 RepID=UPI0016470F41|nr:hypothetical protein [Synechococcus sp. BIOS-E4-1]
MTNRQRAGNKSGDAKLIFADQYTGLFVDAVRHEPSQARKPSLQRKKVDTS